MSKLFEKIAKTSLVSYYGKASDRAINKGDTKLLQEIDSKMKTELKDSEGWPMQENHDTGSWAKDLYRAHQLGKGIAKTIATDNPDKPRPDGRNATLKNYGGLSALEHADRVSEIRRETRDTSPNSSHEVGKAIATYYNSKARLNPEESDGSLLLRQHNCKKMTGKHFPQFKSSPYKEDYHYKTKD